MDLILLQPGDPDLLAGAEFSHLPDPAWRSDDLTPGNCVELVSVQHGIQQRMEADPSHGARTSAGPLVTEFSCVKYVDSASVRLYDYCLRAKPLGRDATSPTFIHILRNAGDKTSCVMSFTLRDAIVSQIELRTNPADTPTEQFRISFTEILWSYRVQLAEGEPPRKVTAGWSLVRKRPIAQFT